MAHSNANGILRAMIDARDAAIDLDDAALLRAFAERREQPAFAELVRRHGPMVLGVCRRVAGPSADDAFQASFLVLARKAAGIRDPHLLAHWLHGVAVRVARRAKRTADRRRRREVPMANLPDRGEPTREIQSDLLPAIDAELLALPEWYRLPIVLCDLQGLSRSEAAARLGIPEGTLSSRLANGRQKLADRLAKRGIAPALALAFLADAARAAVPYELFEMTVQTAMAELLGGAAPSAVTQLASEGISTMGKFALAGLLVSLSALGVLMGTAPAEEKKAPPATPAVAEKRAEEKAEGTTYGKPRMTSVVDMNGIPKKLHWGGNEKDPILFVEELSRNTLVDANPDKPPRVVTSSAILFLQPGRDKSDKLFEPGSSSKLSAVSMNEKVFITSRIDRRGINAVHQIAFFANSQNSGNEYVYRRSILLGDDSGDFIQFTPDDQKLWNSYTEPDDLGKPARSGLRLLDAKTGDVLTTHDAIDGLIQSIHFDGDCRLAVARISKDGKDRVVCWNLETGKVVWSPTPPKLYGPSTATLSHDGKFAAVAYRIEEWKNFIMGRDANSFTKPNEYADWIETKKQLDAIPTTLIHVVATATGKTVNEIALKKMELVDELALSPDGRLLVCNGIAYSINPKPKNTAGNGSNRQTTPENPRDPFAQVWDSESTKSIYRWNGGALFAFDPRAKNGAVLAIAEALPDSFGRRPAGYPPRAGEPQGRIGIWKFVPAANRKD